ncbi:hypothetical protein GCM10007938_03220 [Vibrio zhanjiangensis]|uniref:Uncharacterized protein n=1 Tax=Vibrio zhanjiangensis TaxID=1046128 RepID=A0ABQ6EV33_9VIBR|nr:hypothetical protein GCM10007938_03220 [Vibrio zhanjiangensis]
MIEFSYFYQYSNQNVSLVKMHLDHHIMKKKLLFLLIPVLLAAKIYYPKFQESRQLDDLKTQLQQLLFDHDNQAKVTQVRVENNVLALKINISDIDYHASNKANLASRSHKLLPQKICSSVGLKEWLSDGKWVSIDVLANGSDAITNVRVTAGSCT